MNFKFKEDAKAEIGTEDAFYALTVGGYLVPKDILEDEGQAIAVQEAVNLISAFIQACYDAEIIEEA